MKAGAAFYRLEGGRALIELKAVPGAAKTEFAGVEEAETGRRLRVRVAAAPEDGKANRELRAFLAKAAGCAKSDVRLVSGEKSRRKTVSLPPEALAGLVERAGGG